MSVVITNVTDYTQASYIKDGLSEYIVKINNGPVLARFYHVREDGLDVCLAKASQAVAEAGQGGKWPKPLIYEDDKGFVFK